MNCQYQSAFVRPFRYNFNPEILMCSFEYMLAFWRKKKQQTVRLTNMSAFLFKHPEKLLENVKHCACATPGPFSASQRQQGVAAHQRSTGIIQNILKIYKLLLNLLFLLSTFLMHRLPFLNYSLITAARSVDHSTVNLPTVG